LKPKGLVERVAQGVGPEFKPQYRKKKKKKDTIDSDEPVRVKRHLFSVFPNLARKRI
jgi:hypothetical protein